MTGLIRIVDHVLQCDCPCSKADEELDDILIRITGTLETAYWASWYVRVERLQLVQDGLNKLRTNHVDTELSKRITWQLKRFCLRRFYRKHWVGF